MVSGRAVSPNMARPPKAAIRATIKATIKSAIKATIKATIKAAIKATRRRCSVSSVLGYLRSIRIKADGNFERYSAAIWQHSGCNRLSAASAAVIRAAK